MVNGLARIGGSLAESQTALALIHARLLNFLMIRRLVVSILSSFLNIVFLSFSGKNDFTTNFHKFFYNLTDSSIIITNARESVETD